MISVTRGLPLSLGARDGFMLFHPARWFKAFHMFIWMHILPAVLPVAVPVVVVDDHTMGVPFEAARSPSPRAIIRSDRDVDAPADPAADEEPTARRRVHDQRIVIRHINHGRIVWADLNIRTAGDNHLAVALQIAVVARSLAH